MKEELKDEDIQITPRADLTEAVDDDDDEDDEPAPEGIDDVEEVEPDEEEVPGDEKDEKGDEEFDATEGVDEQEIADLLNPWFDEDYPDGKNLDVDNVSNLALGFAKETDAWEAFQKLVNNAREVASGDMPERESFQISPRSDLTELKKPEPRRSDRPIKAHADLADKFLEVRKAIDDLNQQSAAVRAIIAEKEKVSGTMATELMQYTEEYANRVMMTKKILLQLQDVPPHKSPVPRYKEVIDYMLKKLESISKDMRKEAEEFIEAAKSQVPGRTELMFKEMESSVMGEAWKAFRKILAHVQELGAKSRAELIQLSQDAAKLVGEVA